MTTAEKTIYMFKSLPKEEQRTAFSEIKKLVRAKRVSEREYFKPMTKEEFLAEIAESEADLKAGRVYTWEQIRSETRDRYGL